MLCLVRIRPRYRIRPVGRQGQGSSHCGRYRPIVDTNGMRLEALPLTQARAYRPLIRQATNTTLSQSLGQMRLALWPTAAVSNDWVKWIDCHSRVIASEMPLVADIHRSGVIVVVGERRRAGLRSNRHSYDLRRIFTRCRRACGAIVFRVQAGKIHNEPWRTGKGEPESMRSGSLWKTGASITADSHPIAGAICCKWYIMNRWRRAH